MPLAGKSNQIKEDVEVAVEGSRQQAAGSRSEKLIKCSKKSTLNIWLTRKPEFEWHRPARSPKLKQCARLHFI